MEPTSFTELFRKYITNSCTPEEVDQLMDLLEQPEHAPDREALLRGALLEGLEPAGYSDPRLQQQLENRLQHIIQHIAPQGPVKNRVIRMRRRWLSAAAILLLVAGGGAYYWLHRPVPSSLAVQTTPLANDVAPGGNKALLQLSNGQQIVLDSAANGLLAQQGVAAIHKQDGQLVYDQAMSPNNVDVPELFNTMSTPNGGQYRLRLPDGTMVWLNAASSIRYPVIFSGRERRVSITGEAYFEVAKKAGLPFIVNVADREQVEVLGTHFNINAYADEPTLSTTLLEGRVRVHTAAGKELVLTPGQQAQLQGGQSLRQTPGQIDTAQVMAWKNNRFRFDSADLKKVMRQLARWYNVEVVFENNAPVSEVFDGEMQRSLNLSQVLNGLAGMGVHFRIEGRRLIVTQ